MQSFSQRTLLTVAFVLSLVTIGGNCRGSLAQPAIGVSLDEWQKAFDACVAEDGLPVVRARRTPGISAGVGCARQHEGW
jgi:hypothetical protein